MPDIGNATWDQGDGSNSRSPHDGVVCEHAITNIEGMVAVVVSYPPGGRSLAHRHAASAFIRGFGICNHQCFKKAEEEQLARSAPAARAVTWPWQVMLAVVLAVFMLFYAFKGHSASAQEPDRMHQMHAGHEMYHQDFYSHWLRPDAPQVSCCDEKIWYGKDGVKWSTGHCYPAPDAKLVNGTWWVKFDNGRWFIVPEERILRREASPNPAVGHICENWKNNKEDPVLCFREPVGGT